MDSQPETRREVDSRVKDIGESQSMVAGRREEECRKWGGWGSMIQKTVDNGGVWTRLGHNNSYRA